VVMLCVVVYACRTHGAHTLGAVLSQLIGPAIVVLRMHVASEVRAPPTASQERSECPAIQAGVNTCYLVWQQVSCCSWDECKPSCSQAYRPPA